MRLMTVVAMAGALLLGWGASAQERDARPLRVDDINKAELAEGEPSRALVTRLQILLDRKRFYPGVIDGRMGENVQNALDAFRAANGIQAAGPLDPETWTRLKEGNDGPAIKEYRITAKDVGGPFVESIPAKFEAKAKLARLAYTGPRELLAEKFHMDEDFLREINPGEGFGRAGNEIRVAAVAEFDEALKKSVARIEVDKARKQVRAYADDGRLVAVYPSTIGSEDRPAPSGDHTVEAIADKPNYTYTPELAFEGVKAKEPFEIKPGPNNPVGSAWIDLSEKGYGIHGTPDPQNIGKTESHGCVRLTNWNVEELLQMVRVGTQVRFLAEGQPAPAAPEATPTEPPAAEPAPASSESSPPPAGEPPR